MTHTPLAAQLVETLRKQTPPSPLPALPQAHGYPVRLESGRLVYRVPRRPSKPSALTEAQAQAARLWRAPAARLQRPALHAGHDHPRLPHLVELVGSYVFGEAPALRLLPPSAWERHQVGRHLGRLAAEIPSHKWGHRARLDDVADALGIARPRRRW